MADLKRKYPEGQPTWRRGVVTWKGRLQPTPISRIYTVQISWDGTERRPKVEVLHPVLTPPEGRCLQHVFSDGQLCLHFPDEWSPRMPISETVIPWTSEWLFFHELWLATGKWLGGGHDPAPKPPETSEPSSRAPAHRPA